MTPDPSRLRRIRDAVAQGALSMIDHANHKPANRGKKPKVGGHQASSMSSVDLLCALYLHSLQPGDRLAVKPHAAPVVYSLMHLMGLLPREQMQRLREIDGPQPYPTMPKAPRYIDYTTSSEALGVCATIYDAYAARLHNAQYAERTGSIVAARYFAHCGDGELTEGQIDESLYDAGRWALSNLVWIVDLNRQSLDRVMEDSGRLERWAAAKFRSQGWMVRQLRWGHRARRLFSRQGGDALQAVLERAPDLALHPLLMLDGPTLRAALLGHPAEDPASEAVMAHLAAHLPVREAERRGIERALQGISDQELVDALGHLGGHDLELLIDALDAAIAHDEGPVVLIAHTVKGYQTSAAAHPENHGALLPPEEVAAWGPAHGLEPGPFPLPGTEDRRWLAQRGADLFGAGPPGPQLPAAGSHRRCPPPAELGPILQQIRLSHRSRSSTGAAFQSLNLALLRSEAGPWLQLAAPDVGQTTHLGPVIKATGVFSPRDLPDTWRWLREARRLAFDWRPTPTGQFHALGIAEGNAMLWAYAFGRPLREIEGRRPCLPVVTVYDKFFERGFNQLDYAAYNGARFVAVGTPSGTGLSREAATHQSLQTPRMMMDLPGILAYEPALAADVHAIYLHALSQLWQPEGEAIYLRLSTQPLDQPAELPAEHAEHAVRGAYWLVGEDDRRRPGEAPELIFVASGRKVADARSAASRLQEEDGRSSRILVVTSYEALHREWDAWNENPEAWEDPSRSYHLHELFADEEVNAPLILVGDHVPSVAEWLPGALQRVRPFRNLAPRRNGRAGSLQAVDALHGMHVEDLLIAARSELFWRSRRS